MRDFINKYKSQVIVGVVASLITAFIIWAGKWFISAAPKVGSSIIETAKNFFYTYVATKSDIMVFFLLFLSLAGAFLGLWILSSEKKNNTSKASLFQTIVFALSCIYICFFFFMSLLSFLSINLCEAFEHDITIIYPYVEEREIFQLKSDWALMRSKDDYLAIQEYIYSVKKENSLFR